MEHVAVFSGSRHGRTLMGCALLATALLFTSCKNNDVASNPASTTPKNPTPTTKASPIPTSPTKAMFVPSDNNPTGAQLAARVRLGRFLFYDGRLSVPQDGRGTNTNFGPNDGISCGTCHDPSTGFADSRDAQNPTKMTVSQGFQGQMGVRNAPGLVNVGYRSAFTWDGKFATLEKHAPGPMFSPFEMGNNFSQNADDSTAEGYGSNPGTNDTMFLFKRLGSSALTTNGIAINYADLLDSAYGDPSISLSRIVDAITTFERTITSPGSPFDDYNRTGNLNSVFNESASRGFQLFIGQANCVTCHSGYDFNGVGLDRSGNALDPALVYRNNGLPPVSNGGTIDQGRYSITHQSADLFKFKVPSLRNVAHTAPYMHDGRFATLDSVLAFYNNPDNGTQPTNFDKTLIHPQNFSAQDMKDIIAFLNSLSDNVSLGTLPQYTNPWKQ